MTAIEFMDEYLEEEILVDDQPTNYNIQHVQEHQEPPKNNNTTHEEEFVQYLQDGSSETPDVKPSKKRTKRKLQNEPPVKKSKTETSKLMKPPIIEGGVIKLYAYKDCLGKYDSLIKNAEMPLWYRDGNCLLQKYLRQRCNDEGLFYYSTQIYSCWEEERADEYLEIDAEITKKNNINLVVKIRDIDAIENKCTTENYKELGLTPYESYPMRPTSNDTNDARLYTIRVNSTDISDIDEFDIGLDDTSNDVTEQVVDVAESQS